MKFFCVAAKTEINSIQVLQKEPELLVRNLEHAMISKVREEQKSSTKPASSKPITDEDVESFLCIIEKYFSNYCAMVQLSLEE